jgi:hypothetical protein
LLGIGKHHAEGTVLQNDAEQATVEALRETKGGDA